jgi:hypothetical protein
MGRDLEEQMPNRYVLLAPFGERGTPPPGLESASGLVSVVLPEDSPLTSLFQKGGRYRYSSDKFEGVYQCLEAYPGPQQALMIYPEGLPVDPAKGEYLHWRDLGEDRAGNSAAWTVLQ